MNSNSDFSPSYPQTLKPSNHLNSKTWEIKVKGLVQGVGFRPFIYRIATRSGLAGWVQNTNENVHIRVTGEPGTFDHFIACLKTEVPPAAMIENISIKDLETEHFTSFNILSSHDVSNEITEISPDIAVCDECLEDIKKKGSRLDYAFVNCTNCGPRFTIIRDLPYDRAKTTMQSFEMCADCSKEYETITDRRFHAQPVACAHCGPGYELFVKGNRISCSMEVIIEMVSDSLEKGEVALIKGLGGMHLACDAFNEEAVGKLRKVKNRDSKPFAIMFCDMESLNLYAKVDSDEERSLTSWRRPIVLLEKKRRSDLPFLAEDLSSGLNLLGVMLPYLPFHYLLFRRLKTSAIVLTSGNFSKEPILIDNREALQQFSNRAETVLLHNRDIHNRTDDSVVRVMNGKERLLRRSRGYVPAPIGTDLDTDGILAFGAELTNCFCIGKGQKAILSQHIGDLQELETSMFYEQTIEQYLKLFRVKPSLLAVDLHPAYISTKTGMNFGDLPLVMVQHHHAHVASCMAENHLDERVIGVAFDGTGYGPDGNIWGGEILLCDLNDYSRVTHFDYIPLPGGDLATEEPWRMAVSYLYKVFGENFVNLELELLDRIDPGKVGLLIMMIDKNINCPLTSGAGRLFDAVSALLGLCQVASFQAEGPMRLESLVKKNYTGAYSFTLDQTIRFDETIREIVDDLIRGIDHSLIATKFHNTIISAIFESSNMIRKKERINKVVLSGGVFQNKYLLEGATELLKENKFEVYTHAFVPASDGGIALGQLAVASKRRELRCV
jgi:hydrogenase maturation protein HypF